MGVSRSGCYDYEKRVSLDPDPEHQDLVEMVRKISESSDQTYGARRYSHPVFPNRLERSFRMERPNQGWAGDISDLWTHEGWIYLAVVIDLYTHTRKVVG